MKSNIISIKSTLLLLAIGFSMSSCFDEDEFPSDVSLVVPTIFNFTGPTVGFVGETKEYKVNPRGGSEFIWTVTGAAFEAVPDEPYKILVTFNQFEDPVSVSVYEKVANGAESEVSIIDVTVFGTPCTWTVEMTDLYGDGWNGASVAFTYDGVAGGEVSIEEGSEGTASVDIPDGSAVEVIFNSGDYDEEVVYKVFDANGTLLFEDGPNPVIGVAYTTTNDCPN